MDKSVVGSKSIEKNTGLVYGRIAAVNEYQGVIYSEVKCPAPDPYSEPQSVTVRSSRRFASVGEDTEVIVKLGGWTRTFTRKDGSQGRDNKVMLDLME